MVPKRTLGSDSKRTLGSCPKPLGATVRGRDRELEDKAPAAAGPTGCTSVATSPPPPPTPDPLVPSPPPCAPMEGPRGAVKQTGRHGNPSKSQLFFKRFIASWDRTLTVAVATARAARAAAARGGPVGGRCCRRMPQSGAGLSASCRRRAPCSGPWAGWY